jgi:hypothetical protein
VPRTLYSLQRLTTVGVDPARWINILVSVDADTVNRAYDRRKTDAARRSVRYRVIEATA